MQTHLYDLCNPLVDLTCKPLKAVGAYTGVQEGSQGRGPQRPQLLLVHVWQMGDQCGGMQALAQDTEFTDMNHTSPIIGVDGAPFRQNHSRIINAQDNTQAKVRWSERLEELFQHAFRCRSPFAKCTRYGRQHRNRQGCGHMWKGPKAQSAGETST